MKSTILLALAILLPACSSAAESQTPDLSCFYACMHGDTLPETAGTDGGTDAGAAPQSCSFVTYGTNEAACEDACAANNAASCMAHAETCAEWVLCNEHSVVGVGALPPGRGQLEPVPVREGCTRPGPAPGASCPPGVRCCH
jgi:hypothetical protein